MGADLDYTDLHLSIRNAITRQPYITSDGQISLDMRYESIDWTDIMNEAKVTEIPSAKIVLPSLIAEPGLRPLLQKIQEGDRVELYNSQPDCGDPVLAAFIPPNGISEQDGKTILDVHDTLTQLRWQHLRRFEYLTGNASQLYDRARSIWVDQVNEDFSSATWPNDYTFATNGQGTLLNGGGFWQVTGPANSGNHGVWMQSKMPSGGFALQPGDVYLLEADITFFTAFATSAFCEAELAIARNGGTFPDPSQVGSLVGFANNASSSPTSTRTNFARINALNVTAYTWVDNINTDVATGGFNPQFGTTALASWPMPVTYHIACYIVVSPNFVDPGFGSSFLWSVRCRIANTGDYVQIRNWRARKLVPALLRAGRFNPQTTDALTYQPNNEENLQFLQLIAEKDNAEYRPIYRAWPQGTDELELDAAGTLGKFASRTLGYEQPPALPTEGSPQASPLPVITDAASFLTAPPFRFEEGYNLEAAPKINPRANAHANDVIRVGASSIDSQAFAEKWSPNETGRPQHSPSGAQFPYFEQITNDDRVGIQSLVASLAGFELARRIDTTPSLELAVVDELPWAFRWRVGDQVFTKTLSLRNNLEQELRVQKVQYKAGSPVRIVTLGKTDWDPTMLRVLSESMKISWLYEQSGTNPGIYVYPSVGNILTGASSPDFTIPLDQYTTGSSLVYAALHWFADANVLKVQPVINGNSVLLPATSPSQTDSGLVLVTGFFQGAGTYKLHFFNNDGVTRNLTGAFLVLRIKG
ncbi:MAG TPA: hypothetical protein VGU71_22555 [Candidatus Dormibacteraeota bacterium]|nr:hypothetical protein [Candidatus Dormibacteraeota bacterium]